MQGRTTKNAQPQEYLRYILTVITNPDITLCSLGEEETIQFMVNKLENKFNNPTYRGVFLMALTDEEVELLAAHGIHQFEDTFYMPRSISTLNKWRDSVKVAPFKKNPHPILEIVKRLLSAYFAGLSEDSGDEGEIDESDEENGEGGEDDGQNDEEFLKYYETIMKYGTADNKAKMETLMNKRLEKKFT